MQQLKELAHSFLHKRFRSQPLIERTTPIQRSIDGDERYLGSRSALFGRYPAQPPNLRSVTAHQQSRNPNWLKPRWPRQKIRILNLLLI